MRKVFINIKQLLQVRPKGLDYVAGLSMSELPKIDNAFLAIQEDRIVAFGKMSDYRPKQHDHEGGSGNHGEVGHQGHQTHDSCHGHLAED